MKKLITFLVFCVIVVCVAVAGIGQWKHTPIEDISSISKSQKFSAGQIIRATSDVKPFYLCRQINPAKSFVTTDGIEIYGFSCNDEDYNLNGLIKFNSNSPNDIIRNNNVTDDVTAGAYGGDAYYVMRTFQYFYPGALCTVDLNSGAVTEVVSYVENPDVRQAVEMSYDVTTETMYILFVSDEDSYSTAFGTVDLKTGEQKVINANMNRYIRSLAINKEGIVYAIDQEGMLLTIDKATGNCSEIKQLNVAPFLRQTMEFDRNTGELYWAYRDSYNYSTLKKVDVNTGLVTDLGVIGNGYECVVGLYIPYQLCPDSAPSKVENLTIIPAEKGELTATLNWVCPLLTYSGEELSLIDNIKIYRNGELVEMLTDVYPGKEMSYIDTPPSSGIYTYKIVASNSDGEGLSTYISSFIGTDLPSAVEITSVKRVGNNAIELMWDAPTSGINNGYFDIESIRYSVTRISDKKLLAKDLTQTSFTDNSITELNSYRYEINVYNKDGNGGSTQTGYIVNGPSRNLPMKSDFNIEAEAKLWSVGDANHDGVYFFWQYNQYERQGYYYYQTEWEQDADDWLISPPIKFESDKKYKMVVSAKPSSAYSPEIMEFYILKDYNLSTAVKIGETINVVGKTNANDETILSDYRAKIENIESGEYSVAVRCISTAWDGYWLAIGSIEVSENEDGNLRGDVWDDSQNPVEGVTITLKDTDYVATTDSHGQFEIAHVPEGEYTVICSKLGYKDSSKKVTIKTLETTNVELDIVKRKEFKVSGEILDEYGSSIKNASVVISGYNGYATSTDEQGKFQINGVFQHENDYTLCVEKDFYDSYISSFKVDAKDVEMTVSLSDKILPAAGIKATIADDQNSSLTEWTKPGYEVNIAKHSAFGSYTFGTDEGDASTLLGVVCRTPIILESICWTAYCDSDNVNIVVLALDKEGNATNKELYKDENVSNNLFDKSNYNFPEPIYAPDGCFVGISIDSGNLSLLTAENTEEYPFVERYNAYIENYILDTTLNYVEELGEDYRENFFISYDGIILASDEAPITKFNVYRIDSAGNESVLNQELVATLSFTDNKWPELENGDYTYAVEAVYLNGKVSERIISNVITQKNTSIENINVADEIELIELYDINGLKVFTTNDVNQIGRQDITPGIYVARVLIDGKWNIQKLVIK